MGGECKIISNENKVMLSVLSNALHSEKKMKIEYDWQTAKNELIAQSVYAIPANAVELNEEDTLEYL